ncbi:unnamed protein product [Rangifer tarandus platyrhynchus]|uniref:Uncharacterized protein n=1 Tax=Rangifer tarandus platyrhynchus TaxID=3082113 RepID=A0AC59ZXM4_RANTA
MFKTHYTSALCGFQIPGSQDLCTLLRAPVDTSLLSPNPEAPEPAVPLGKRDRSSQVRQSYSTRSKATVTPRSARTCGACCTHLSQRLYFHLGSSGEVHQPAEEKHQGARHFWKTPNQCGAGPSSRTCRRRPVMSGARLGVLWKLHGREKNPAGCFSVLPCRAPAPPSWSSPRAREHVKLIKKMRTGSLPAQRLLRGPSAPTRSQGFGLSLSLQPVGSALTTLKLSSKLWTTWRQ